MGKLIYGGHTRAFDIDDRALAHLRLVFMTKLRRSEPFMFHVVDTHATISLWIHPAISLMFHFYGGRQVSVNHRWIEELMLSAHSAAGLTVTPEPADSLDGVSDTRARLRR